jgi:L-aspartate oxidase
MPQIHPSAELAPRDLVARAVFAEIAAGRGAFLDARSAVGAAFPERFPAVFAACMRAGIDPRRAPIPVAPAAHYHMGGIAARPDGRTSLEGLLATGECASTGAHGANRLASNSLLEGAAFGAFAGETAREASGPRTEPLAAAPPPDLPADALRTLRTAMSRDAGVVRDGAGLTRLIGEIEGLEAADGRAPPLVAARIVAEAALDREESRGGHFRADFPLPVEPARHTRLVWKAGGTDPVRIAAE